MNKTLIALLASLLTLGAAVSANAAAACCAPPARGNAEAAKAVTPVRMTLASYMEISNALAADDLASAKGAARTLMAVSDITGVALACPEKVGKCDENKKDCCAKEECDDEKKKGCDEKKKGCDERKGCTKGVQAFIDAEDLKQARELFKVISAQAIALAANEEGFYVMTCPMAGRNAEWLQADQNIRNPYHGSAMLACGVIK